jgi:hypothetical protein
MKLRFFGSAAAVALAVATLAALISAPGNYQLNTETLTLSAI